MATPPSAVLSTNPINLAINSPVPTLSAQSSEALPTGSPGALSLQVEVTEDDPFAHEMRSTSTVIGATAASTIAAA